MTQQVMFLNAYRKCFLFGNIEYDIKKKYLEIGITLAEGVNIFLIVQLFHQINFIIHGTKQNAITILFEPVNDSCIFFLFENRNELRYFKYK